jgi:hypothetical protein
VERVDRIWVDGQEFVSPVARDRAGVGRIERGVPVDSGRHRSRCVHEPGGPACGKPAAHGDALVDDSEGVPHGQCRGSAEECLGRFDNLARFGGFPGDFRPTGPPRERAPDFLPPYRYDGPSLDECAARAELGATAAAGFAALSKAAAASSSSVEDVARSLAALTNAVALPPWDPASRPARIECGEEAYRRLASRANLDPRTIDLARSFTFRGLPVSVALGLPPDELRVLDSAGEVLRRDRG